MREDFREKLEEMFPGGYVILYPTNSGDHLRIAHFIRVGDGKAATDQLTCAVNLIQGDANNGEEWKG